MSTQKTTTPRFTDAEIDELHEGSRRMSGMFDAWRTSRAIGDHDSARQMASGFIHETGWFRPGGHTPGGEVPE